MTQRVAMDNYPTQPQLAAAMVKAVMYHTRPSKPHAHTHSVLEPSAGTGVFVDAVRHEAVVSKYPTAITAIEPRAEAAKKINGIVYNLTLEDALQPGVAQQNYDLAIGNPPYSHAQKHIELLKPRCWHVAFLLRMSFFGSQERSATLWAKPNGLRWLIPIVERPSFVNGKTDNSEYGIFIWQREYAGRAEIGEHLWWRQ